MVTIIECIECGVYRATGWELCGVEVFIREPPVMNWKSFLWSLYLYGRVCYSFNKNWTFLWEQREKEEKKTVYKHTSYVNSNKHTSYVNNNKHWMFIDVESLHNTLYWQCP